LSELDLILSGAGWSVALLEVVWINNLSSWAFLTGVSIGRLSGGAIIADSKWSGNTLSSRNIWDESWPVAGLASTTVSGINAKLDLVSS
jgi:hypothetical protein